MLLCFPKYYAIHTNYIYIESENGASIVYQSLRFPTETDLKDTMKSNTSIIRVPLSNIVSKHTYEPSN